MNGGHVAQVIRYFWIQLIQIEMMDFIAATRCWIISPIAIVATIRGRDDIRTHTHTVLKQCSSTHWMFCNPSFSEHSHFCKCRVEVLKLQSEHMLEDMSVAYFKEKQRSCDWSSFLAQLPSKYSLRDPYRSVVKGEGYSTTLQLGMGATWKGWCWRWQAWTLCFSGAYPSWAAKRFRRSFRQGSTKVLP